MSFLGELHAGLVFRRRVRVLAGILAELLPRASSVLDVGCGDGSLARALGELRPDLSLAGLDVAARPEARFPVELFDGVRIPREDRSVDAVTLVDVLHHAEDPEGLLGEAARVSRKCVVLKDHRRNGFLAGPTLRFMDWVGNAPHGVALPYNYRSEDEWREAFRDLGLRVAEWRERLGLYPFPANLVFGRGLHFVARLERDGT